MAIKSAETKLYFQSRLAWQRPAFLPTIFFLSLTWTFCLILLFTVVTALFSGAAQLSTLWIIFTISVVLLGYLTVYSKKYSDDIFRKYEFELADREIRLRIDDWLSGNRLFAHMPFGEISFVEHYTPRDNASLVFHGRDDRIIEVPIWSMTEDVSPILDLLNQKRISIVRL